jgi:hypothetical protein
MAQHGTASSYIATATLPRFALFFLMILILIKQVHDGFPKKENIYDHNNEWGALQEGNKGKRNEASYPKGLDDAQIKRLLDPDRGNTIKEPHNLFDTSLFECFFIRRDFLARSYRAKTRVMNS